jgi:hypothetical protein
MRVGELNDPDALLGKKRDVCCNACNGAIMLDELFEAMSIMNTAKTAQPIPRGPQSSFATSRSRT